MDDDEDWCRNPWEDEPEPPAERRSASSGERPKAAAECLLIPLARAQDAVARLEASVAASPLDVAAGLRSRLALFEAAGFLAHHGPAVHPHDLALRDAGLTGSFALAAMTGRLKQEAPWTMAEREEDAVADDHLVACALAYARHWRRLAEHATLQPLKSVETLAAPLAQLGAPLAGDETTRVWLDSLLGPNERPGLLAAAAVMAAGLPGREREDRLDLAASYVAASLWRRHGYGRSVALSFWSAPVSRIDGLGRGGEFERGYLDCIAEAAHRGIRELDRLNQAAGRIAALPGTARSRLHDAGATALREPLITGRLLADKLAISTRAALDLIARLVTAGVLREMTGRGAWRGYTLA
jgi:HTH DNA binding domain